MPAHGNETSLPWLEDRICSVDDTCMLTGDKETVLLAFLSWHSCFVFSPPYYLSVCSVSVACLQ